MKTPLSVGPQAGRMSKPDPKTLGAEAAEYRRASRQIAHPSPEATLDAVLGREGGKLGDMPIYQNAKFNWVINLKTAKALGITIPPSLLGCHNIGGVACFNWAASGAGRSGCTLRTTTAKGS